MLGMVLAEAPCPTLAGINPSFLPTHPLSLAGGWRFYNGMGLVLPPRPELHHHIQRLWQHFWGCLNVLHQAIPCPSGELQPCQSIALDSLQDLKKQILTI
jgi:hypothetical protein